MAREIGSWLIGSVWLSAIAGGFWALERYDSTPGAVSERAPAVDEGAAGRWCLTVFAHPRCPCSRATWEGLTGITAAAPDLTVRVRFVLPPGTGFGWERGELWDAATRITGAEVAADVNGNEARRFGAETSGQAVLTDPSGRVVFRGGLTPARGRTGACAGRRAVLDWVEGRTGAARSPVFGCPLFTPGE